MSEQPTIEQRLAALETAVREIRQYLLLRPRTPDTNWLEKVIGSMKDEPAFLEVVEYGRAFRQADRPSDDEDVDS